jgi:hypothetical protein
VESLASGGYEAIGEVESWRGSIEDLHRVVGAAVEALAEILPGKPLTLKLLCTKTDGTQVSYASLSDFLSHAGGPPFESVSAVRMELDFPQNDLEASVVARRTIPGVVVSVTGANRIEVDGLAQLLFEEAMHGYVDRYPVARWLMALVLSASPVLIAIAIVNSTKDALPLIAEILITATGVAGTLASLVPGYRLSLTSTGVEFVPDLVITMVRRPLKERLRAFFARRRVRAVLGSVTLIALGIVTNKLSDLIPWPN